MGWGVTLLSRFRDIIPGSVIRPVYDQTDREYEAILKSDAKTTLHLVEDLGDKIYSRGKNTGREKPGDRRVIVVSTQRYKQEDTMVIPDVAQGETAFAYDCLGHRLPVQCTGEDALIFHAEGIPSCGRTVYSLMEAENSGGLGPVAEHSGYAAEHSGYVTECSGPWSGSFENDWYEAEFNDKMGLISLVGKGTGGQLLGEGRVGNQLLTFEGCLMSWDSWDVNVYYQRKSYYVEFVTALVLEEWGSIRTTIPISYRPADLLVEQDVISHPDLSRIDFVTRIDRRDHYVLLRVYFPAQANAARTTYEVQFGSVEGETTSSHNWDTAKFEVCVHRWTDPPENGLGLSPLNDCKYRHNIRDGEMELTPIKSGTYPNESASISIHELTYSIYPHKGWRQEARTVEVACGLNSSPVSTLAPAKRPGGLWSRIPMDQPCCFVEVVRKMEDGSGYILCIYENRNTGVPMAISFGFKISHVEECDLLEGILRFIETDEYGFKDFIEPYEIKAYHVSHTGVWTPAHQESEYKGGFAWRNKGHGEWQWLWYQGL